MKFTIQELADKILQAYDNTHGFPSNPTMQIAIAEALEVPNNSGIEVGYYNVIDEETKLIAEFMGYEVDKVSKRWRVSGEDTLGIHGLTVAETSKIWDWEQLMRVVTTIENLGFECFIVEHRFSIHHNTDHSIEQIFHIESKQGKKDSTYCGILWFIEKFNNGEIK